MATNKKVAIPFDALPPMTSDGKYLVRYRVVSDDKNRISAWSPTYSVSVPYITKAITNIVGNSTIVTYTTSVPHGYKKGDIISISGTDPIVYSYPSVTIDSVGSEYTFSVAKTDHTNYVSGGRVNLGAEIKRSVSASGKAATVSWSLPATIYNKSFDVFVRIGTGSPSVWGNYTYYKTVTEGSCTYVGGTGEDHVQFLVQASTYPQVESPVAIIFYSAEQNI